MKPLAFCAVAAAGLLGPIDAGASLCWMQGIRTTPVPVCFVGDALTSRPARVAQILGDINGYTLAAGVRFTYLGTCPASAPQGGKDCFGGDVRAVIRSTSAYTVSLAGTDLPRRVHNGSAKVRVLTPTAMDNGLTGSLAAITVMLTTVDEDLIFASGFE
jgi:hypothetical protein